MARKQEDTKQLEEKMVDLENQLKRAVADYQNLEKRIHSDSQSIVDYSKNQLIKKLLPVLDSLDAAALGADEAGSDGAWIKGVLMSIKQMRQVLSEEGLVEIETSDKFDPNLHEAVDVKEGEENKILQVIQRGYTLNGKVLRPAKVLVGKIGENK